MNVKSLVVLTVLVMLVVVCSNVKSCSGKKTPWPTLPTGEYQVRDNNLFGFDWKIATVQFDIEKDSLQFPIVLPCFECFARDSYKEADDGLACVCDYSSKSDCGSAPKGCPKKTCDPDLVQDRCEFNQNPVLQHWTEIQVSHSKSKEDVVVKNIEMTEGESKYFRFTARDPCRGYKVKALLESGLVDFLVSMEDYQPNQLYQEWSTAAFNYPDRIEVDLCPEFSKFNLGTVFITAIARTNVTFDLHLFHEEPTIDKADNEVTNDVCTDDPDHICIQPGRPYEVTQDSELDRFIYFRYDLKVKKNECKTLTVYAEAEYGDVGLGGDFTLTTPNYYSGGPLPTYQSEYSGSDILHFQKCFEESGEVPFYFGVYLWSPGSFLVRVSEKKDHFLLSSDEISEYQYAYTATKSLMVTCPGYVAPVQYYCNDWKNYCKQLYMVSPAEDPHPFWPLPNQLRYAFAQNRFTPILEFSTPLEHRQPGSLAAILVLSGATFDGQFSYLTEDQLAQCTFTSLNGVFNKEGYAIQGVAPIKDKNVQCKATEFGKIVQTNFEYFDKLRSNIPLSEIMPLTLEIDSLTFTSQWVACRSFAESFVDRAPITFEISAAVCLETDPTSPEFLADPCCNVDLQWNYCCVPKAINYTTEVMSAVNSTKIEAECTAGNCTNNFVYDVMNIEGFDFQCSTYSSSQYPMLIEAALSNFISCKDKYNIDAIALGQANCHSHAECSFGGFNSKCNFVTGKCIPSRALEKATVKCIAEGLDLYSEYYFKSELNLPGRKNDSEFIDAFFDAFSRRECRNNYGHQSNMLNDLSYMAIDKKCTTPRGCTTINPCLDSTCTVEPNNCLVFCENVWERMGSNEEQCGFSKKCNWMGDDCDSAHEDCDEECHKPSSDSFCAYCYDDTHCVEIPQLDSKKNCEDVEACILPDGTLELMSEEDCKQVQQCTKPCHDGQTCVSIKDADRVCYSADSQSDCDGIWRFDIGLCTFPLLGEDLCTQSGNTFFTCESLSLDECSSCFDGSGSCSVNQTLFGCRVAPVSQCTSKDDCVNNGGVCDDSLFYKQAGRQSDDFGACLVPFQSADFAGTLPVCLGTNTVLGPQGCTFSNYISESDCLNSGYTNVAWHSLASSEVECTSLYGCDIYNDNTRAYGARAPDQCVACGATPKQFYNWESGKWVTAVPTKLKWQSREVLPLFQWSPTVDFEHIETMLVDGAQEIIYSDLRSQTECDIYVISMVLHSVACACESGDTCFYDLSTIKSGSTRPCIGHAGSVQNPLGSLHVSNTSVPLDAEQRCTPIDLVVKSLTTIEKAPQDPFSPMTKVRDYKTLDVVLNDDHAIVGMVMSSGFQVTIDGELDSMEICFLVLFAPSLIPGSERFSEWDLAVLYPDDHDFLTPADIRPNNNSVVDTTYCFDVKNPEKQKTYYLVYREKDYENKDGSLYGSEAIAWWIFAALYTVLAVLTMFTYMLHYFGYPLHYYFLGLFLFTSVMCTIRAIYFYLLASRVFDEGSSLAVAYFLIEFPTLLYFTAFSMLGAFWLFLLYAHFQSKARRYILFFVVLFNIMLYVLFIVLLILFQTLPTDVVDECPGRVAETTSNTNQHIISIFYQSFMAGVSILLAVWVSITGSRLLIGLKKRHFEGKIAMVTFFCAVGLLLHCGFILYLSITFEYHFTIIVIMIVLSELVPIFCITIQFSLLRQQKAMQKYSKKAHFLRTLFFGKSTSTSSTNATTATTTTSTRRTVNSTINSE